MTEVVGSFLQSRMRDLGSGFAVVSTTSGYHKDPSVKLGSIGFGQ